MLPILLSFFFFFFNDTATTEIYTLSLHDALPISQMRQLDRRHFGHAEHAGGEHAAVAGDDADRKSTRLNSSHVEISYAVFCLKKKKKKNSHDRNIRTTSEPSPAHRDSRGTTRRPH